MISYVFSLGLEAYSKRFPQPYLELYQQRNKVFSWYPTCANCSSCCKLLASSA